MLPPKQDVVDALKRAADESLVAAERAQAIATDEATSDQSKAEGKYDTRATEASYLARGQAERVVQLRDLVHWYERLDTERCLTIVKPGALVALEGEGEQVLFVGPVGGQTVSVSGVTIKTISLVSPLGRALNGLSEGDDVTFRTPGGLKELEVISIT